MKRFGLVALLAVLLAACSGIPFSLDLLPYLPESARSGSEQVDLLPGAYPLDLKLPNVDGQLVDAGGADFPGKLTQASVEVALDVTVQWSGSGSLSGAAAVQVYLAPEGADLWQDAYKLGQPVSIDLADALPQRVETGAELSAEQLDAVNGRRFLVGGRVTGEVESAKGGTVTLSWELKRVVLSGNYTPL